MTDNQPQQPKTRRTQGGGLAWKSGLVASSVGTVLLGWALLGRVEATPASTVAQIASPQPRMIVVQVPISVPASNGTQQLVSQPAQPAQANAPAAPASTQAQTAPASAQPAPVQPQVAMPAMPQRPVFQQPVTQTRGS